MKLDQYSVKERHIIFAYKKLWEYMPCVDNEKYIDGQSYNEDIELIRELLKGY